MDEGFAAYIVIGEGLLSEVEELVTHLIVMYNEKASVAAVKSVTYGEGMISAITFLKG